MNKYNLKEKKKNIYITIFVQGISDNHVLQLI